MRCGTSGPLTNVTVDPVGTVAIVGPKAQGRSSISFVASVVTGGMAKPWKQGSPAIAGGATTNQAARVAGTSNPARSAI